MNRVGIISENSVAYVRTLIDIWNRGDTAVLVDWRIPAAKSAALLIMAGVNKCYVDSRQYQALTKQLDVPIEQLESITEATKIPADIMQTFQVNYSDTDAVVFFSSGTTGQSKGVVLSHNAINTNADKMALRMNLVSGDSIYIAKTLAHSSTLVCELLVGLQKKLSIYVAPSVASVSKTLKTIDALGVTILCINPTLLKLYNMGMAGGKYLIKRLRSLYISGAVLNKDDMKRARALFSHTDVYNIYGLTELGPRVSAQTKENYHLNGTVGKPLDGIQVKVVDDMGKTLPLGCSGKVLVQSPSRFTRYLYDASVHLASSDDGYFDTGDMGYLDKQGNLYIVGRYDDMIIKGAHNVFPQSVEEMILSHPDIEDCIVFGVEDAIYGQNLVCLYTAPEGKLFSDEIRAHCMSCLADYEIPSHFIRVQRLPMTPGGKKSRYLSKEMYNTIMEGRYDEKSI